MPVSSKRRRNGKLKKRAVQLFVPLNKGEEKEKELKEMYTDKKRLNQIKNLKETFVVQMGNAKTSTGKCIAHFNEEGNKVRTRVNVVTSITLQRTKDKVRGRMTNLKKLFNKGVASALQKYDPNLLMEQSRHVLNNFIYGVPVKGYSTA